MPGCARHTSATENVNSELERQVRARALEVLELLMQATERSDAMSGGRLLSGMSDEELERRLVAAVLRAVVSVAAEQRGLATKALTGRLFVCSEFALPGSGREHVSGIGSSDVVDDRLASAIRDRLTHFENDNGQKTKAWAELPVEAIGGVYESLIGLGLRTSSAAEGRHIAPAKTRKRTGSFFTPPELTAQVVSKALEPLLERAVGPDAERLLLELRVCDPALGAGAFLLEACRQLARRLGALSNQQPGLALLGEVATRCLYGVDLSPLCVALAEASLWLLVGDESLTMSEVGKRLRVGDSLAGFDWAAEFEDVLGASRGFDAMIGNPPWVAFAKATP